MATLTVTSPPRRGKASPLSNSFSLWLGSPECISTDWNIATGRGWRQLPERVLLLKDRHREGKLVLATTFTERITSRFSVSQFCGQISGCWSA